MKVNFINELSQFLSGYNIPKADAIVIAKLAFVKMSDERRKIPHTRTYFAHF